MPRTGAWLLSAALVAAPPAGAAATETLVLRGQAQGLHLYGARGGPSALVASGDGGWIHLGPEVAEFLAGRGFFVAGFDSKAYLSSFTSGKSTLDPAAVPGDFAELLAFTARGGAGPPLIVGVSEGAGLGVLAAADARVKARALGLVALGLPAQAELGWRFRDSIIYVTKGVPKEPLFETADVVGQVAPLPLVAIHSTHDEFAPVEQIQRVMARAGEPHQLWLIPAANHRFSDATPALQEKLLEAVDWIRAHQPAPAGAR